MINFPRALRFFMTRIQTGDHVEQPDDVEQAGQTTSGRNMRGENGEDWE